MSRLLFSKFRQTFITHSSAWLFLAAFSVLSFTQTVQAETLIDRVVAVVNNKVILKSELNAKMFAKEQELAAQNIQAPSPKILREKVLDAMILERLQIERAKELGLDVQDEEINEQLNIIAKQNALTLMALRKRLDLEMPDGFSQFRQQMKTKILIQKLREMEVIGRAYVSKTEVENYLQRQALDNRNEEVELGHLLIELPDSATPMQRESTLAKAEEIHLRIKNGEDFSQMAIRYSNGSKALNGGILGWFKQSDVPTFFAEAIAGLEVGQTSGLVQSPSGFHLIKLINKKSAGQRITKAYHLHRFLVPNENIEPGEIPADLMMASQSLRSLSDFKKLNTQFPDILPNVNANSDLGWKNADELPPGLQEELMKMNANRALLPLATPSGWMILFLEESRIIEQAAEEKAQQAMQAIRMRKANEMFDLWLRRLKDEAFIQIRLQEPTL